MVMHLAMTLPDWWWLLAWLPVLGAAVHGKDTKLYVNGYNLTGSFRDAEIEGSKSLADSTTFGKSTREYLAGVVDGMLSGEGLFEGSANDVDEVLQPILGSDPSTWCVLFGGDTVGNRVAGLSAIETRYSVKAPVADVVRLNVEAHSKVGREGLVNHYPLAATTGDTNGTAVDGGAASTAGGVGYVQVTAFSGFSGVSVKIQDSADGSTDWQDILTFTNITAARAKERVAITGTVRRYTRAVIDVTGTGSITVFVAFGRKPPA